MLVESILVGCTEGCDLFFSATRDEKNMRDGESESHFIALICHAIRNRRRDERYWGVTINTSGV
jgi:hypothetical protein